jgi:hypothetical protein
MVIVECPPNEHAILREFLAQYPMRKRNNTSPSVARHSIRQSHKSTLQEGKSRIERKDLLFGVMSARNNPKRLMVHPSNLGNGNGEVGLWDF